MINWADLQDYTRYTASQDDLKFLQALQKEWDGEDCVFLASSPGEGEEVQVIKPLGADAVQTLSYVGLLVFQERTVAIRSRFDGKKGYFLRYRLENVWGVSSLVMPIRRGPPVRSRRSSTAGGQRNKTGPGF